MTRFRIGSALVATVGLLALADANVAGAAGSEAPHRQKLWVATVMPGAAPPTLDLRGRTRPPQSGNWVGKGASAFVREGTVTIPLRLDELQG